MRFLQIATFYPAYLDSFYARAKDLIEAPFERQIAALLDDGFGAGHLIAPHMSGAGFESLLIVTNCLPAQTQWALSRGLSAPQSPEDTQALVRHQIAEFAPDILYVLDPIAFDDRFIASLDRAPGLTLGWRAANIPDVVSWSRFDVMLSSDAGCRAKALDRGAKAALPFRPGFPRRIAEQVAATPKSTDIVFCGQITAEHSHRFSALQRLIGGAGRDRALTAALHLGLPAGVAPALKAHDRGSVWGLDMYRAVRGGRIAPNFHIDLAVTKNQNMRILETTGVGTFLLTEADPHLADTFTPGREVETYASEGELSEKARHYLAHDAEREAIARQGQSRCFSDHGMERRAAALAAIIGDRLKSAVPRSRAHAKASNPAPTAAPSIDPDIEAALRHLAANRLNEAAAHLNEMVQRRGHDGQAVYLLGRVAFLVGQTASAAELFQTAAALNMPQEWLAHALADAATALFKLKRSSDALTSLRRAYALAPQSASFSARLAALLERMGADDEAALVRERRRDLPAVMLDSLVNLEALDGGMSKQQRTGDNEIDLGQSFPGVVFGDGVQCVGVSAIRIGKGSAVGDGSWLNVCIRDATPRMVIGSAVLIGRRAVLSSGTLLEIGSHTIFGPNVYVSSAEHEYVGNHTKPILMCGVRDLGRLVIEENCWIGMNAVVDGDLTIGRGSVIGANSVVRRSVPPFSVAVGAPARVVRMLNPATNRWEPIETDADRARIEAARAAQPFPERAAYRALLDTASAGQPLHPVVAGLGLHLP